MCKNTQKHAEVSIRHNKKPASTPIYNQARVEAADKQGAAAAPASPRDRPLMNSLFTRMGTNWSARPNDAPPPPGDGPRAPPPPPLDATTMPGKDDDVYRPRDRSPDSVLEDPSNWARDDGSASSEATPPPRALERAASAPAAASCSNGETKRWARWKGSDPNTADASHSNNAYASVTPSATNCMCRPIDRAPRAASTFAKSGRHAQKRSRKLTGPTTSSTTSSAETAGRGAWPSEGTG